MEIFPMSQQVMSAEDLDTLGRLFVEAKNKLLGIKLPAVPGTIATQAAKTSARPQTIASGSGKTTAQGLGIGSLKV
jgi:hypothetical protein